MGITTKQYLIDDVDQPNINQAPKRPDYRYADYTEKEKKHDHTVAYAICGVVALLLVGCFVVRFGNYIISVNQEISSMDRYLLALIKITFALACMVSIALCVVWLGLKVSHVAVIRLQNGQPMSVIQLLLTKDTAQIFATLDQYYAERKTWAEHSDMWSVQTLDQSVSAPNTRALPHQQPILEDVKPESMPALIKDQLMLEMMIDKGLIDRSGNSILVGFHAGKPVYIELNETGMIALAGMPRVGKSSTATSIIAQILLMHENIVIVCDKHGKKADSLLTRLTPIKEYLHRSAIEIADIIDAIDLWYEIGSNRLLEDSDRQYPVCMIAIDEFTAMLLQDMLPPASITKLLTGAIEFPKVQAHGLIIGHQWTGKLIGNPALRRVTTQRIIHRIDPQDAGFLISQSNAKTVKSLETGHALFTGASQASPLEIAVPYISVLDLEYLARVLQRQISRTSETSERKTIQHRTIESLTADERARLARVLLAKQVNGKYTHTLEQVQTLVKLRDETIVALSRSIGRSK